MRACSERALPALHTPGLALFASLPWSKWWLSTLKRLPPQVRPWRISSKQTRAASAVSVLVQCHLHQSGPLELPFWVEIANLRRSGTVLYIEGMPAGGYDHSLACSPGEAFSPSVIRWWLITPNDCLFSFLSHFGYDSSFGSRWQKKSHCSQKISGFWIQLLSKRLRLTSFSTQSLSQGSGAEIRYLCCYWKWTVLCVRGAASAQISLGLSRIPRGTFQWRN